MAERIYLNNEWKFSNSFEEAMILPKFDASKLVSVRIPHTVKETPLHYFDENEYQMVSGYIRKLDIPAKHKGKKLLLTIDGAAHSCEIYVNGTKAGEHHCGYTAVTVDITEYINFGEENTLVVKVDSRESQNIPPFGFVIDYMTYGGIYRDVYLDIKNPTYMSDVFVSTRLADKFVDDNNVLCCGKSAVVTEVSLENATDGITFRQYMRKKNSDEEYRLIGEQIATEGQDVAVLSFNTGEVEVWDVESPTLYEIKTQMYKGDELLDESIVAIGFRKAVFKKSGFYLNGRKFKIRGLNRHQSYPYVGYAMPESMQKMDADILKKELGLNAVRTSHYPQSHYFLDRCDELGLLVFTELPGWQHIGDEQWKQQAVINVEDMIRQYRNHTSIVLWGVRINESVDDDEFYERTNAAAARLDSTRATGGVRCYKKSNLLEDVYTYNDFVHTGNNRGVDKKSAVTSNMEKAYLVSEYMGHMFPTKTFDWEEKRAEHAIRHANVLEDVLKNDDIAGSFGWCMFDYNTHKDFGSGDRICYHGVMDMFRNPKLAAAVYASGQHETPVLEISSTMDIGEHPGCNRGETYIFTNADSVKMYKGDAFIKEYTHDRKDYKYLENPPIKIDDYIGDLLQTGENMPKGQAEEVKSILNEVAKFGLYNMSKTAMAKAGKMMLVHHMSMDDAVKLYNKYIGDWGGESVAYRFEAIKDGEVVATVTKAAVINPDIRADVSHNELVEKNSYDVAAVRINAVDESGNVLPYYNDPVILEAKGAIELIGPSVMALSGGMGGTYVKSKGKKGKGKLIIKTVNGIEKEIDFTIDK